MSVIVAIMGVEDDLILVSDGIMNLSSETATNIEPLHGIKKTLKINDSVAIAIVGKTPLFPNLLARLYGRNSSEESALKRLLSNPLTALNVADGKKLRRPELDYWAIGELISNFLIEQNEIYADDYLKEVNFSISLAGLHKGKKRLDMWKLYPLSEPEPYEDIELVGVLFPEDNAPEFLNREIKRLILYEQEDLYDRIKAAMSLIHTEYPDETNQEIFIRRLTQNFDLKEL